MQGRFFYAPENQCPMTALYRLLQEILSEVPALLQQLPDTETIHRFRLRIKQLRAIERLQGQELAWRCIADVYRTAGAIRDLEHRLAFTAEALGTSHLLYRHLRQTRPEREQSLKQALREFDRYAFPNAVKALAAGLPDAEEEEERVWSQCRRWLRKSRFRQRKSRHKEEALHEARKTLKQALHLLQCFHEAETLKPLRNLEQDIGRWHDEWDWCRQAAEVMGSSGKEAFPEKQLELRKEYRMLRKRVLGFRLRELRQKA